MKNVAILEFETHSHLLYLWDRILQDQNSYQYHFFVSKNINKQLRDITSTKITVIEHFIDLNNKLFSYDLVIINTLHRNFEKYALIFENYKTLLLVHNSNFYFKSANYKFIYLFKNFNVQLNYYYLKLIYKEKIYKNRSIINRAGGFGFLSEEILNYNSNQYKNKYYVPLFYNKSVEISSNQSQIKIVIPGNISQRRRDYDLIFKILPELAPKANLCFVFLGKPENIKMQKKLENFSKSKFSNRIQIKYYSQWISQKEFDAEMFSSHYLLCPLHKETSFYLQKEIYGKTKISGNETDCIYYGKIGIFPEFYKMKNWDNLYYKNQQDLINILENITFEKYIEDTKGLLKNAKLFSQSNACKHMINVFDKLINV